MSGRFFVDTNTLVYILAGKDPSTGVALTPAETEANRKGEVTFGLLHAGDLVLAVQVFNELCNVSLRRKFDWNKTKSMLTILRQLCHEVKPLTIDIHQRAILLHEKYRFQLRRIDAERRPRSQMHDVLF
ncbi:MAG: hypothetical protein QFF03_15870 [Pseudomonadota bacterium]|nr:hypothetical protein [Pseudomonadota bacterium]